MFSTYEFVFWSRTECTLKSILCMNQNHLESSNFQISKKRSIRDIYNGNFNFCQTVCMKANIYDLLSPTQSKVCCFSIKVHQESTNNWVVIYYNNTNKNKQTHNKTNITIQQTQNKRKIYINIQINKQKQTK